MTYYEKLLARLKDPNQTNPEEMEAEVNTLPGGAQRKLMGEFEPVPEELMDKQEGFIPVPSEIVNRQEDAADEKKPETKIDIKPSNTEAAKEQAAPKSFMGGAYKPERGLGMVNLAQAFAPLADYLAKGGNTTGQLAAQGNYIRTDRQYDDPNSPISKRAQNILARIPEFRGKDLENISYNAASKLFPQMKEEGGIGGIGFDSDNTQKHLYKFMSDGLVQDATKAVQSYNVIKGLAQKGESGPDDIAIVFNFMKSLDPASTVRDSEFMTADEAAGKMQKILNYKDFFARGTRFTQEQRNDFVRTSYEVVRHMLSAAEKKRSEFINTSQGVGADPKIFSTFNFNPNELEQVAKASAPKDDKKTPLNDAEKKRLAELEAKAAK